MLHGAAMATVALGGGSLGLWDPLRAGGRYFGLCEHRTRKQTKVWTQVVRENLREHAAHDS